MVMLVTRTTHTRDDLSFSDLVFFLVSCGRIKLTTVMSAFQRKIPYRIVIVAF